MNRLTPLYAAIGCAAAAALVDVLTAARLPGQLDLTYAATLWALTVAAAAVLGLAVVLAKGSASLAVAGWVLVEAAVHYTVEPGQLLSMGKGGALLAVLFAAIAFLGAKLSEPGAPQKKHSTAGQSKETPARPETPVAEKTSELRGLSTGLAVGWALGLALTAFPEWMTRYGPQVEGFSARALRWIAFSLLVTAFVVAARRRRVRWLGPAALATVALLSLVPPLFSSLESESVTEHSTHHASDLPNILLIVLDTVRADHLSIYGYERETTPGLAQHLAQSPRGRLYPLAFSTSNWTIPAHASLMSGVMPTEHGAHTGNQQMMKADKKLTLEIRAEEMLAERLSTSGYKTAGVFANPYLGRVRGMERGFARWQPPPAPRAMRMFGEELRQSALPWLFVRVEKKVASAEQVSARVLEEMDRCGDAPCFVFANYMDAHSPYLPPASSAGRFTGEPKRTSPRVPRKKDDNATLSLAAMRYDEEIHYLDQSISSLITKVWQSPRGANTWIVITSDHGEAFMEHGVVFHGSGGHNEQVRIPLVIFPPEGVELPQRQDPVDLLDVTATLAVVGSSKPLGDGRNLADASEGVRPVAIEFYACENKNTREVLGQEVTEYGRAVVFDGFKLMESPLSHEVYALSDLDEQRNLYSYRSPVYLQLAGLLPSQVDSAPNVVEAEIDPEIEAQLRALGYLQ